MIRVIELFNKYFVRKVKVDTPEITSIVYNATPYKEKKQSSKIKFTKLPFVNVHVAIIPTTSTKELKRLFGYMESRRQSINVINDLIQLATENHFQLKLIIKESGKEVIISENLTDKLGVHQTPAVDSTKFRNNLFELAKISP